MAENAIAICDQSETYVLRLADEISGKISDMYTLYTFTSPDDLYSFWNTQDPVLILISESSVTEEIQKYDTNRIVILSEEGMYDDRFKTIDRYKEKEELLRSILQCLTEQREFHSYADRRKEKWKVIGFYSPVKRSLQTTFALTLGRLLARKHKVLYVSFESFPTISGFQNQQMKANLTDVLYYFDCDAEKLVRKLPLLIGQTDGLDFLPAAETFFDTYERVGEKWMDLFTFLEQNTDYEYFLLDLSEGIQGLLQILQYCDRIYTMEKDDPLARSKLLQYEQWMQQHAYADIIEKTRKFLLPIFQNLPTDISMLTHSELLSYVQAVLQEDLHEL